MTFIIGNAFMLLAATIMVSLGFVKDKNKIIIFQTIQIMLLAIGDLLLGSIPGFVISIFACIRNVLTYFNKLTKPAKVILIILCSSVSLYFNNIGIFGILPVIVSVVYICFIDTKDICKYKLLEIFSNGVWFAHDFYIKGYIMAVFDVLSVTSNAITFVRLKFKKK